MKPCNLLLVSELSGLSEPDTLSEFFRITEFRCKSAAFRCVDGELWQFRFLSLRYAIRIRAIRSRFAATTEVHAYDLNEADPRQ